MKRICDYQDRDSAASLAIMRTRLAAGYGYSIAKSAQLYKAFQKSRPETVLQLLKQRMPLAQRAEPELFNVTLSSLLDRIYVAPDTILLPAPEQEDVVNNVYQAVASQQYMQLSYIDSRRQQQQLCFLPWGLMFKGLTTYLVGKKRNSSGHRLLAMHRITNAQPTEIYAGLYDEWQGGDSFQAFCQLQGVGFFASERDEVINIHLRFYASAGHLLEMQLSEDQQVTEYRGKQCHSPSEDPDYFELEVKATVRNGRKLQEWLRSFGSEVEVVAPEALRNSLIGELQDTLSRYQNKT
ncbi:helix-turn-helix transcriptional regulator [Rheinheimera sp.]